jgi:hypothetical protein
MKLSQMVTDRLSYRASDAAAGNAHHSAPAFLKRCEAGRGDDFVIVIHSFGKFGLYTGSPSLYQFALLGIFRFLGVNVDARDNLMKMDAVVSKSRGRLSPQVDHLSHNYS